MQITNYQMQNVLKVYSRQLSKNTHTKKNSAPAKKSSADKISISIEGKLKAIYNNVTADIVNRITRGDQEDKPEKADHEITKQFQHTIERENSNEKAEFIYHTIDNSKKKTNSLSIKRF
ncbi:MAG: DVU0524 family FlgM-associated protein [Thermodesulfobacteriota bacterium]|nr:DVU0524 family FlgM-associated protein [Thermodesulfobacteriota bacterium]